MVFVDGTNFLTRLSDRLSIELNPHKPPRAAIALASRLLNWRTDVLRSYWIGSYQGDPSYETELLGWIRQHGFQATLFRKPTRARAEKGVDMGLAVELLVNAFHRNFDIGVLVAGDEDYVRLAHEAKRYGGAALWGRFFDGEGMSPKLKLALDHFVDLDAGLRGDALKADRERLLAECPPRKPHRERHLGEREKTTAEVDGALAHLEASPPEVAQAITALRALRDRVAPPTPEDPVP